jgi:hypothetical protein
MPAPGWGRGWRRSCPAWSRRSSPGNSICSSPRAARIKSMSRATSAVLMWSMIAPPRWSQASARYPSAAATTATPANVNGSSSQNAGSHCRGVPKQRNGVLRAMPLGSKPTTSNRARSSGGKSAAIARTRSTPEPPGPPGFISADALSRLRRRQPDEREQDALALRGVVVERNRQGCALEGATVARRPVNPLRGGAALAAEGNAATRNAAIRPSTSNTIEWVARAFASGRLATRPPSSRTPACSPSSPRI